jgi:hypothetical protein
MILIVLSVHFLLEIYFLISRTRYKIWLINTRMSEQHLKQNSDWFSQPCPNLSPLQRSVHEIRKIFGNIEISGIFLSLPFPLHHFLTASKSKWDSMYVATFLNLFKPTKVLRGSYVMREGGMAIDWGGIHRRKVQSNRYRIFQKKTPHPGFLPI